MSKDVPPLAMRMLEVLVSHRDSLFQCWLDLLRVEVNGGLQHLESKVNWFTKLMFGPNLVEIRSRCNRF